MSGHSKFANIKHKKEKNDAKKGKIFTVIGRELVMAVKAGGPDPNNNSKLRDVIAKAKANNMPNDTIERGIKKAAGADSADNYEKAVYEGYGPNGVAIIVETLTDNKNRTAGNVRNAFTKGNGSIGTPIECPPPRTSDTVGILNEAIISAMASPASTSPPTVFKRISKPSISSSSSMMASFGSTCSYFVVLEWEGADS